MNILCISKYASIPGYGTGARLFYLANEFNKLGHNTILITSDANHLANFPNSELIYNVLHNDRTNCIWIRTKKYLKTASISRVISWFDFEWKLFRMPLSMIEKPEVVVVSSLSIFTIVFGYYLKRKFKAFLVFEIRDIWPLTMTEEGGFSKWHPLVILIGWIEKFGYKVADLIVGTMPRLDLHVKNILGYVKPFFCSPLGFLPKNYQTKNEEAIPPHIVDKFPKSKIIVGYAGSMGITNALGEFIEAIKSLSEYTDIHFMMVGSGDFRDKYEINLQSYNNVTFLPRIKQEDVKYFLSKCDILYLSTQDSKVWLYGQSMNKVVEYMLASKPIIARYSGYPSMIDEADCGIIVSDDSKEAIRSAILKLTSLTRENREEIGKRGYDWINLQRPYSKLASDYIDRIKDEMEK